MDYYDWVLISALPNEIERCFVGGKGSWRCLDSGKKVKGGLRGRHNTPRECSERGHTPQQCEKEKKIKVKNKN